MVFICGHCGYEVEEDKIKEYTLSEKEILKHAETIQNNESRKRFLAMGAWRCPGCGRTIRPLMINEALNLLREES